MSKNKKQNDEPVAVAPRSMLVKLAIAAIVVAISVVVMLNWPPPEIVIESPTLQAEATATAYFANLDKLADYAAELEVRKAKHPEFRQVKFADFAEMKTGAQALAEANPALRDDAVLWAESQKAAVAYLQKMETLDYALTASGL